MPDYRSQFVDAQAGNAGQPASATAQADLAGSAAVRGAAHLPALVLSSAHARSRADFMRAQKARYIAEPLPMMNDGPEGMRTHRAYLSMDRQERGYIASADLIEQAGRDYELATAPAYAASAAIARAHAVGASLAFEGQEGQSGRTNFANHTNRPQLQRIMAEHPEIAAANASVEVAGGRFMVARLHLRDKTIAYRGFLAGSAMADLEAARRTDQTRLNEINARIAQVTGAISTLGSVISVVSGNLASLEGVASGIDRAMGGAGHDPQPAAASGGGSLDLDDDEHDPQRPRPVTQAELQAAQAVPLEDRQVALTRAFEQAQVHVDYQRSTAPAREARVAEDRADAQARGQRTAARNGEVFGAIDRAHRRGQQPNLAPIHAQHDAQDVAAGRAPDVIPTTPTVTAQIAAVRPTLSAASSAVGVMGSVADAAMRLYFQGEMQALQGRINAIGESIASWQEIRDARQRETVKNEYDTALAAYHVEGQAYEATVETRREHYQHLGLLMDREQAAHAPPSSAGAAQHAPAAPAQPTNEQDVNSQTMLYMSVESEANSRLQIARRSVGLASNSVESALNSMAHRREPYETRDDVLASPRTEETGPDQRIAWQMQEAIRGWLATATTEEGDLAANAASGRQVTGRTF